MVSPGEIDGKPYLDAIFYDLYLFEPKPNTFA
jgi:hypothetical protein